MKQREFTKINREIVCILVTIRRGEVATALGIGKFIVKHWRRLFDEQSFLAGSHTDVQQELILLLRENELLCQE